MATTIVPISGIAASRVKSPSRIRVPPTSSMPETRVACAAGKGIPSSVKKLVTCSRLCSLPHPVPRNTAPSDRRTASGPTQERPSSRVRTRVRSVSSFILGSWTGRGAAWMCARAAVFTRWCAGCSAALRGLAFPPSPSDPPRTADDPAAFDPVSELPPDVLGRHSEGPRPFAQLAELCSEGKGLENRARSPIQPFHVRARLHPPDDEAARPGRWQTILRAPRGDVPEDAYKSGGRGECEADGFGILVLL